MHIPKQNNPIWRLSTVLFQLHDILEEVKLRRQWKYQWLSDVVGKGRDG